MTSGESCTVGFEQHAPISFLSSSSSFSRYSCSSQRPKLLLLPLFLSGSVSALSIFFHAEASSKYTTNHKKKCCSARNGAVRIITPTRTRTEAARRWLLLLRALLRLLQSSVGEGVYFIPRVVVVVVVVFHFLLLRRRLTNSILSESVVARKKMLTFERLSPRLRLLAARASNRLDWTRSSRKIYERRR